MSEPITEKQATFLSKLVADLALEGAPRQWMAAQLNGCRIGAVEAVSDEQTAAVYAVVYNRVAPTSEEIAAMSKLAASNWINAAKTDGLRGLFNRRAKREGKATGELSIRPTPEFRQEVAELIAADVPGLKAIPYVGGWTDGTQISPAGWSL